jgi:hypothetical protein
MPEWPVKKKKGRAAGLKDPEEPLPPHIPPFLPSFPSKHAYIASPAYQERLEVSNLASSHLPFNRALLVTSG